MILPTYRPSILIPSRKIVAATDVTPNAVDWANIAVGGTRYTTKQITGIDTTITLSVNYTGATNPGSRVWYKVETAASAPSYTTSSPSLYGFTQILALPGSFSVTNNQYVSFGLASAVNRGSTVTITVTNTTNANTQLDTFTISY